MIKDVSANGCSFVTSQELEIGGRVIVSFSSDDECFIINKCQSPYKFDKSWRI